MLDFTQESVQRRKIARSSTRNSACVRIDMVLNSDHVYDRHADY
ncbi:hypothetical protein SAMN05428952_102629 [Nitrosomonas sp. Nm132]|jgi:hypothetical protein|nr:hypothetical protein SAMN05428952_102629 [Nitrosomonas sp. Nm132]